jgi:methylmalonyl-CoA mutase N-terminal domain/subunit
MEEKAAHYIEKIDNIGGVYEAIAQGFFQREIADSAYKYQQEIDKRARTIVGINEYCIEEPQCAVDLLRIDPKVEEEQITNLRQLRHERDNHKVKQILDKLHDLADKDKNLMPVIVEAVKTYATLGEITDVLRNVYGEYKEMIVI